MTSLDLGGLGILAGDCLKAAGDRGLPRRRSRSEEPSNILHLAADYSAHEGEADRGTQRRRPIPGIGTDPARWGAGENQ